MVQILPSILAADFARLNEEIERVERAGVSMLHLDVMDGHFVPNISFGPPVVAAIRSVTQVELDVHLMITDPDRYIEAFARAGANLISVHQETCTHLNRTLRAIQAEGMRAGVVLNPATPVPLLDEVLDIVDYVLLMSVNPGFGGQQFIRTTLRKVMELDRRRQERELTFPIEVDGGVVKSNVRELVQAGANWLVAGTSIFGAEDSGRGRREMQQIAREAMGVRV
ncbi:MAG: ribulose-phosphate 3-epimerase [Bryobacteraceae bacterium]